MALQDDALVWRQFLKHKNLSKKQYKKSRQLALKGHKPKNLGNGLVRCGRCLLFVWTSQVKGQGNWYWQDKAPQCKHFASSTQVRPVSIVKELIEAATTLPEQRNVSDDFYH